MGKKNYLQQRNYYENQSRADYFYHAVCFSPTKCTWISVTKQGFFKTWPNMILKNVKIYLIESTSYQLRHKYQTRQIMELTKSKQSDKITNMLCTITHDTWSEIHMDFAGQFPILLRSWKDTSLFDTANMSTPSLQPRWKSFWSCK